MTIADDEGNELPKDGIAFGRLLVKGPTIVERYFKTNESSWMRMDGLIPVM
ncbi:MAG: hypothetical protein Ct9H300mP3_03440 [Gammaproteobacteria bacterium]|nr:MAG: hypothetical protein Ct9H300mP3_03440 [Gammaproteobacteria bacterium]